MAQSARQMADILLACLVVALRDKGGEEVCSTAVYHGDSVTLDYADCGGMAWVRLVGTGPSQSFPAITSDLNSCGASLAHTFELGVMRAAPLAQALLAGAGVDLPDDAENSAAASLALDDMEAMWDAIRAARQDIELLVPGSYTPVGPTGGSLGGTWSVTVGDDD
jgi:hypothetical protein